MPPGDGSFPRIAHYGFLSDCHTSALVAPDGSVEWLCTPRFDSASVLAAILDRDAGSFRFAPADESVPVGRRYEPGTNVLETTWMTDDGGWLVVRDALAIDPWRHDPSDPHRLPPTGEDAEQTLVRVARCLHGEVEVELNCSPAPDYGRARARWAASDDGARLTDGSSRLALSGDLEIEIDGPVARGSRRLRAGEGCFASICWGSPHTPDLATAERQLDSTAEFWRTWLGLGRFPDHPWRHHLQRSALALKGLTYRPTGALIAAPTTSLPESPGGSRNWDYRYTWIRDATFALWGLHVLGFHGEADDFAGFVADIRRARGPDAHIMYGISGEQALEEHELDHLSGYDGARPVRVGNEAYRQRQNDVYGALLDALYINGKVRGGVRDEIWTVARDEVEGAIEVWREPDQGIWETRGEPRHYISSKLMCWVALERGARLARQRGDEQLGARWGKIAEQIRTEILTRGVSERGVFRQHYESDALDASALLVPLVRFLPADDERVRATVLAIADELTEAGLVLRYRVDQTDDGFGEHEATFTMCSFWLVAALSEIGERRRAAALCEHLLAHAGPLGLYAEELDPHTGCHWGNFPQAFTHLSLINGVSHVIADQIVPRELGQPTAVFGELRRAARRRAGASPASTSSRRTGRR